MNKQTARELLMDYLYDEISAADKEKLQMYLQDHPEMRQELEQMQTTRRFLQQMPDKKAEEKILLVDPGTAENNWRSNAQMFLPKSTWGRTVLAAAACILLLLAAGSLANFNMQSTKNGFAMHLGYAEPPHQSGQLSRAQTEAIIKQVRRENTAILTEYADMLNKHNQQQLQQVVEHLERERRNDLQTISTALNQYQQKTDYRLQQTHEVMGQMLQTVASNIHQ